MKLRGQKLEEGNSQIVVFERPKGPIAFTLSAVLNTSDFEKIYPPPVPPEIIKNGVKTYNVQDKRYVQASADRNRAYTDWIVLNTIAATPELEWEKVNLGDANTWKLWRQEIRESGFSDGEIIHLIKKVMEVNGLDEERLEVARKSFLLGQAAEALDELSSLSTDQAST